MLADIGIMSPNPRDQSTRNHEKEYCQIIRPDFQKNRNPEFRIGCFLHKKGRIYNINCIQRRVVRTADDSYEFVGDVNFRVRVAVVEQSRSAHPATPTRGDEVVVGCRSVKLELVLADCEVGDERIVGAAGVGGIAVIVEPSVGPAELEDIHACAAVERVSLATTAVGSIKTACQRVVARAAVEGIDARSAIQLV